MYLLLGLAVLDLHGWLIGTEVWVISNAIPWDRNLKIMRNLVYATYILIRMNDKKCQTVVTHNFSWRHKYHCCWCIGSLCQRVISIHVLEYVWKNWTLFSTIDVFKYAHHLWPYLRNISIGFRVRSPKYLSGMIWINLVICMDSYIRRTI